MYNKLYKLLEALSADAKNYKFFTRKLQKLDPTKFDKPKDYFKVKDGLTSKRNIAFRFIPKSKDRPLTRKMRKVTGKDYIDHFKSKI